MDLKGRVSYWWWRPAPVRRHARRARHAVALAARWRIIAIRSENGLVQTRWTNELPGRTGPDILDRGHAWYLRRRGWRVLIDPVYPLHVLPIVTRKQGQDRTE